MKTAGKQLLSVIISAALVCTGPGMGGYLAWAGGDAGRRVEMKPAGRPALGRDIAGEPRINNPGQVPQISLNVPLAGMNSPAAETPLERLNEPDIPISELSGIAVQPGLSNPAQAAQLVQPGLSASPTQGHAADIKEARQAPAGWRPAQVVGALVERVRSLLLRKQDVGRVLMDNGQPAESAQPIDNEQAGAAPATAVAAAGRAPAGPRLLSAFLAREPRAQERAGAVPPVRIPRLTFGLDSFKGKIVAAITALAPASALADDRGWFQWFDKHPDAWIALAAAPFVVAAAAAIASIRPVGAFLAKVKASSEMRGQLNALTRFYEREQQEQATHVVVMGMSLLPEALEQIFGVGYYETRIMSAALEPASRGHKVIFATSDPLPEQVKEQALRIFPSEKDPEIQRRLLEADGHGDLGERLRILQGTRESIGGLITWHRIRSGNGNGKGSMVPKSLTQKALEDPRFLKYVRRATRGRPAILDTFIGTDLEWGLSRKLGIPIFGPHPSLARLGAKDGNKELFEAALGKLSDQDRKRFRIASWRDGGRTPEALAESICDLFERKDDEGNLINAVMIKGKQGTSGGLNAVLAKPGVYRRISTQDEAPLRRKLRKFLKIAGRGFDKPYDNAAPRKERARQISAALPQMYLYGKDMTWEQYLAMMASQGVLVEELIPDFGKAGTSSPSGQGRVVIRNGARVAELAANHEQIFDGDGVTFRGLIQPADPKYSALIDKMTQAIGDELAALGYVGDFAVDYFWDGKKLWIIEANLRKGGPSQALLTARARFGAQYDPNTHMLQRRGDTPDSAVPVYYTVIDHLVMHKLSAHAVTLAGKPVEMADEQVMPLEIFGNHFWAPGAPFQWLMLNGDRTHAPSPWRRLASDMGAYYHLLTAGTYLGNYGVVIFGDGDMTHTRLLKDLEGQFRYLENRRLLNGYRHLKHEKIKLRIPQLEDDLNLTKSLYLFLSQRLPSMTQGERIVADPPQIATHSGHLSIAIVAQPGKRMDMLKGTVKALVRKFKAEFLDRPDQRPLEHAAVPEAGLSAHRIPVQDEEDGEFGEEIPPQEDDDASNGSAPTEQGGNAEPHVSGTISIQRGTPETQSASGTMSAHE